MNSLKGQNMLIGSKMRLAHKKRQHSTNPFEIFNNIQKRLSTGERANQTDDPGFSEDSNPKLVNHYNESAAQMVKEESNCHTVHGSNPRIVSKEHTLQATGPSQDSQRTMDGKG